MSPRRRLGRRGSSPLSRYEGASLSSSLATGDVGPLRYGVRVRDIYFKNQLTYFIMHGTKGRQTQDLTPPINPKLYPVAKSSFRPAGPGLSGRPVGLSNPRDKCVLEILKLERGLCMSKPFFILLREGLLERLLPQN